MANWTTSTSKYWARSSRLSIEAWRTRDSGDTLRLKTLPAEVEINTNRGGVSLSLPAAKWVLKHLAMAIEYAESKSDSALGVDDD